MVEAEPLENCANASIRYEGNSGIHELLRTSVRRLVFPEPLGPMSGKLGTSLAAALR